MLVWLRATRRGGQQCTAQHGDAANEPLRVGGESEWRESLAASDGALGLFFKKGLEMTKLAHESRATKVDEIVPFLQRKFGWQRNESTAGHVTGDVLASWQYRPPAATSFRSQRSVPSLKELSTPSAVTWSRKGWVVPAYASRVGVHSSPHNTRASARTSTSVRTGEEESFRWHWGSGTSSQHGQRPPRGRLALASRASCLLAS